MHSETDKTRRVPNQHTKVESVMWLHDSRSQPRHEVAEVAEGDYQTGVEL